MLHSDRPFTSRIARIILNNNETAPYNTSCAQLTGINSFKLTLSYHNVC